MKSTFTVQNKQYEITLEKKERAEGDKFHPYVARVSGQSDGVVEGTCQITDDALKEADELASSGGASALDLLAKACGKSLASELVIRKLEPEFSFVIDHRWLH